MMDRGLPNAMASNKQWSAITRELQGRSKNSEHSRNPVDHSKNATDRTAMVIAPQKLKLPKDHVSNAVKRTNSFDRPTERSNQLVRRNSSLDRRERNVNVVPRNGDNPRNQSKSDETTYLSHQTEVPSDLVFESSPMSKPQEYNAENKARNLAQPTMTTGPVHSSDHTEEASPDVVEASAAHNSHHAYRTEMSTDSTEKNGAYFQSDTRPFSSYTPEASPTSPSNTTSLVNRLTNHSSGKTPMRLKEDTKTPMRIKEDANTPMEFKDTKTSVELKTQTQRCNSLRMK